MVASDPYLHPANSSVLRNKINRSSDQPHGTSDEELWRGGELLLSSIRLAQLAGRPDLQRAESFADMKALHAHIFGDVYDWAGQPRTWPADEGMRMVKEGSDGRRHVYGHVNDIERGWRLEESFLARSNFFRGMPREQFLDRFSATWAEVNRLHAFREGNTRSQFAFFTILAAKAGYRFDASQFGHDGPLRQPFIDARFAYQDSYLNASDGVLDTHSLRQVVDPALTRLDADKDSAADVLAAAFPLPAVEATHRTPQTGQGSGYKQPSQGPGKGQGYER